MKATATEALIEILKTRFANNSHRHQGIDWSAVQAKLRAQPKALLALEAMERTGGEPDVVAYDDKADVFTFVDCAAESPTGRRSLCYDRKALDSRKENKPSGSALECAVSMGVEILSEQHYRALQALGEFDCKTSSWVHTPAAIRDRGGALFCDRRYNHVFVYHNGAESYYAARGFRAQLKV